MHIYLAGRYRDQTLLRQIRTQLESLGHKVTSRWLDAVEPEDRPDDPTWASGYAEQCANRDMDDIDAVDYLVLYLGEGGSTRGGMYVELGYAIALSVGVAIVGPRTNVFTYLSEVDQFNTWDAFFDWLRGRGQ